MGGGLQVAIAARAYLLWSFKSPDAAQGMTFGKGLAVLQGCRHVGMSAVDCRRREYKQNFWFLNKQHASLLFFILLNYPHENLEIKERKVGTPFALLSSLPVVAMCHRNIESLSQEILT